MNWDRVEGSWKQLQGQVKQKWALLTEDDMMSISGNRDKLEGLIQERYGYGKDRVQEEVDHWLDGGIRAVKQSATQPDKQMGMFGVAIQQSFRDQPIATAAGVISIGFVLGAIWRS
jgi:uncharacterized protein YjbJ (UPF0337 family)